MSFIIYIIVVPLAFSSRTSSFKSKNTVSVVNVQFTRMSFHSLLCLWGAPSTLPALSLSVCTLSWPLSTPGICSCRCLCWSAVAIRSICWTSTLRLCWGSTSRPSSSGFCRSRLKAVARHPGTSSCGGRPGCSSSQPGERERENVSRLAFKFSFRMMSFDGLIRTTKDHCNYFCI